MNPEIGMTTNAGLIARKTTEGLVAFSGQSEISNTYHHPKRFFVDSGVADSFGWPTGVGCVVHGFPKLSDFTTTAV